MRPLFKARLLHRSLRAALPLLAMGMSWMCAANGQVAAGAVVAASSNRQLLCPGADSSGVRPPIQTASHHKVILSWKASIPTTASNKDPVLGYCVYRSAQRRDPSPQLVTPVPFVGTSCTDDLVQDDQTYYYEVITISSKGKRSVFSDDLPVTVPGPQTKPNIASQVPPPLCRPEPLQTRQLSPR